MDKTILPFNGKFTSHSENGENKSHMDFVADLGIRQFKKMLERRVQGKLLTTTTKRRLIRDFKKRQWDMYHEYFPQDNSSFPTHSAQGIDI